ncbi:MAG: DUF3299 domain-containing protein [Pseudomonadota bacterium]
MNIRPGLLFAGAAVPVVATVLAMAVVEPEAEAPLASPAILLDAQPGFRDTTGEDPEVPTLTDDSDWGSGYASLEPIAAEDVESFALGLYTDVGYRDAEGRYVIDLLEQDYAYLSVIVTDPDGRPVVGASPSFVVNGSSELLEPEEVSSRSKTDASGTLDFALIGGPMGLDSVTVSYGDAEAVLRVNVISLRASGFPTPPEVDGGLPWSELMGARIRYRDASVSVEFPEVVQSRGGEQVKLSGFMMPLDPDLRQRRFLLTSNPPSCFFHIPGGPAGAVEVLAPDGIEATWDPVVLEGRFELLATDEYGVIYRLHDAELLQP